jgi:hypothetical protein
MTNFDQPFTLNLMRLYHAMNLPKALSNPPIEVKIHILMHRDHLIPLFFKVIVA